MTQLLNKNKLVAIILCFTMLFSITSGIFTEAFAADETAANTHMVYDVTNGKDITLGHAQKATLTAQGGEQWQIYIYDADMWVDIAGKTGSSMELSYPLVASALTDRGTGELRCKLDDGSYSGIVNLVIDFSTESSYVKETEEDEVVVLTGTEELLEETDEELLEEEEVLDENQDEVLDENIDDPAEENTEGNTDENLDEDTTEETPADGTTEKNTEQTTPDSTTDYNTTQESVVQQPADTTTGEDNVTTPEPSNTQNGSSESTTPETPKSETVTKEEPSLLDKLADGIKDKVNGAIDALKNFFKPDADEEEQDTKTPVVSEPEVKPAVTDAQSQEVKKEAAPVVSAPAKTVSKPVVVKSPQVTENAVTDVKSVDNSAANTVTEQTTFALTKPAEEPSGDDKLLNSEAKLSGTTDTSLKYDLMTTEEEPELKKTYTVTITYVYSASSGEEPVPVSEPYIATLTEGIPFKESIEFPVAQGYLPYIGDEQISKYTIDSSEITENQTISVIYRPAKVKYTVLHYKQMANSDQYAEPIVETLEGYTKAEVPEEVAKVYKDPETGNIVVSEGYEGFYALLFERPTIAADDSTVVRIYYDRHYYLMNFDMGNNGYGSEPVYARYGDEIGEVKNPVRKGYKFLGWSLDGKTIVTLPKTMPAGNVTYTAIWEPDLTAKVTVVFWGENADDTQYSYIKSEQVDALTGEAFTYNPNGTLKCTLEPHTHGDGCVCSDKEEHSHSLENNCYTLNCEKTSHNHATAGCSTANCTHRHSLGCIGGCRHQHSDGCYTCGETQGTHNHTIDGGCYKLNCNTEAHTHSEKCCSKTAHTHSSDCYMNGAGLSSNLWEFDRSETVTVAADGSSVVNVYYKRKTFTLTFKDNGTTVYTLTEKWGADISEHWPIKGTNGSTYNNGERWSPEGSSTYEQVLVYISIMPAESFTLKVSRVNYDTFIMHYMVEALPGEDGISHKYNNVTKTFKEKFKVTANYNHVTEDEDFFDLAGFTQWTSNPRFNNGSLDINGGGDVYFYYTRNVYDIEFYNPTELIKKEDNIPYEENLGGYDFKPDAKEWAPAIYEPGTVDFDGWYLNPECTGDEYVLSQHTMPATFENGETALSLYAKWVPVKRTVQFYLDKKAYENGTELTSHPSIQVPHGQLATVLDPVNSSYKFVGWFYMEDGKEKAFDFAEMPVRKDMQVYAKWSSDVLVEYSVYFKAKIDGVDTEIGEPIIGSALAGTSKTFEAKGGSDLYTGYQEGYFPLVKSHNLDYDLEDASKNTFIFWYEAKSAVPYMVRYVDEQGNTIHNPKIVADNRKAVVTEKFEKINKYMPDAYQKQLVINSIENDVEENYITVPYDGETVTIHKSNIITFVYSVNDEQAYYRITHHLQDDYKDKTAIEKVTDASWRTHSYLEAVGKIGAPVTADSIDNIPGYEYYSKISKSQGAVSGDGLELDLYYVRKDYPYLVYYREKDTGKDLKDPVSKKGKYKEPITEFAVDIDNYEVSGSRTQNLIIEIEENSTAQVNIITFYYTEKDVTVSYQAIGPEGATDFGSVSRESETLKVLTGNADGSKATAKDGYRFVGWFYKNENGELEEVTEKQGSIDVTTNHFTPKKMNNKNVEATYYAKFERALVDLTIVKTGWQAIDSHQSFIFTVKGTDENTKEIDMQVVIHPETKNSVTIKDLPAGDYTVTENTDWSWRYSTLDNGRTVTLDSDSTETFSNNRNKTLWLDGNAWCDNLFGSGAKKSPNTVTATAKLDIALREEENNEEELTVLMA